MKTGIVDVGGGLRGIYAAGVLDYCMDKGIRFDLGIGVSAGSANLISYAAGQRGRNYRFYTDYSQRREYMGVGDFLKSGSYINMDYMYSELSNAGGEDPLDYPAVRDNPMELYVVAADAETGEAHYFSKDDIAQDNYDILKASSSIPFVCRPYPVQGRLYYGPGACGQGARARLRPRGRPAHEARGHPPLTVKGREIRRGYTAQISRCGARAQAARLSLQRRGIPRAAPGD